MMRSPLIRAALWQALRPLMWGWGAALVALLLVLAGLMRLLEQQTLQSQQLQSERDSLAAQYAQASQDRDLSLQYRQRYAVWMREGLISDEPLATWRALQLQKILDWLDAQPDWVRQSVQLELQPAQPWSDAQDSANAPLAAAVAAGSGGEPPAPGPSAQTLRVSGDRVHDIEAWGLVREIQRLLGSSAALQQCRFKTGHSRAEDGAAQPSADQAVASIEWECQWTLFYLPRSTPASGSGQP